MRIDYRKAIVAVFAAILLAIPIAVVLQNKNQAIEASQSENNRLQLDIKKRDSQIEKIKSEKSEAEKQTDELRKRNEQLEKDLQAKRERQAEEAKLAAAKQQEQRAAVANSSGMTCRQAIAQTWPAHLQEGANIVMLKESGDRPNAIGAVNKDAHRSQDFGCFQINNHWHKAFFANNDWSDPVANSKYAYSIYQGRGNWTAWYAVQGILW